MSAQTNSLPTSSSISSLMMTELFAVKFALADKDSDGVVDLGDLFQHLDYDGNGWSDVALSLIGSAGCVSRSLFSVGFVDDCALPISTSCARIECGVVQCRAELNHLHTAAPNPCEPSTHHPSPSPSPIIHPYPTLIICRYPSIARQPPTINHQPQRVCHRRRRRNLAGQARYLS
jgi:hypothetical protein